MEKDYLKTRFEQEEFEALKNNLVKYDCALNVVLTQLNNLNAYYNAYGLTNPIEHIKSRIKSPESIAGKLKKKNLPVTAAEAEAVLKDIAGIRIICSYTENVLEIAQMLGKVEIFEVLEEKNYLTKPKPSGYRSYHMIIEVSLGALFHDATVPVEIQIRTSAQDFWATLEHKVRYKYGGDIPQHLSDELQNCAEQINVLDERMYLIHELVDLINADEEVKE